MHSGVHRPRDARINQRRDAEESGRRWRTACTPAARAFRPADADLNPSRCLRRACASATCALPQMPPQRQRAGQGGVREDARVRPSVASAPSARSRGNPEDSPRHPKRTRWAGTIATRFDRLPRARSPRGFVGARRTPPPRSPRRRDDTRASRRRGERRRADADDGGRRPPQGGRPTTAGRGRPAARRGDVFRYCAGTFFEDAADAGRRRAISRARESERRREDAHEKPHGDEEPLSVRLEMTMAAHDASPRLGRW